MGELLEQLKQELGYREPWQTGAGKKERKTWKELIDTRVIRDETILKRKVAIWKFFKKKIVFTNGCFDLFHEGHWHLLTEARQLGDVLIVAINSDESVRKLKGPTRPVMCETLRYRLVASLLFVDLVVPFDDNTPERLIRLIKPDILVKGADYSEKEIVGADFVKSYGGKVVRIPLIEGVSTSSIINKIKTEQ